MLRKHGEPVSKRARRQRLAFRARGPSDEPTSSEDVEPRITELERELVDTRREAERAREEARALDQRVRMADQVLTDVLHSLSWRLTQPLRVAKHSVARLRVPRGR